MWFDPYTKLAEIAGNLPATSATTATQAQPKRPVSQVSRVSQDPDARKPAFRVASVATVVTPRTVPSETIDMNIWRHGASVTGNPRTWRGRVVSLNDWRSLTEWERHGPNGRHWCGITRKWIEPKGELDG
jgi:hypothetical protein